MKLKSILATLAGATLIIATSGCNAVIVAPFPHCNAYPIEVCHDYHNAFGWHHECGVEYHHDCVALAAAPVGPVTLGQEFNVSYDSAKKLIQAASDANDGKLETAASLGLGADDMAALANSNAPTDKGIQAVAANLNQDPERVRDLITTLMSETKTNLANQSQAK